MVTLFKRTRKHSVDFWPADSANLYGLWVTSPTHAMTRLASRDSFTAAETDAAELWSAKQSPWGLRACVHRNHTGSPTILEVFGPDDLVPHCIMYPATSGIQADEFSGDSRVYPCLDAALQEIAPLH